MSSRANGVRHFTTPYPVATLDDLMYALTFLAKRHSNRRTFRQYRTEGLTNELGSLRTYDQHHLPCA